MATLERAIVAELKVVTKNPKLRLKDIMEWRTGASDLSPLAKYDGDTQVFLPDLQVWVAYKMPSRG